MVVILTVAGSARGACPAPAPWLEQALQSAIPAAPELELGSAGDALIGPLLSEVCTAELRSWLPATCAPFEAGGLALLRLRLIQDLATTAEQRLAREGLSSADPRFAELAGTAAVVRAALEGWDDASFEQALVRAAGSSGGQVDLCGAIALPEPTPELPELAAAALLMSRAGAGREGVLEVARRLGKLPGDAPSELQERAIEGLLRAYERALSARAGAAALVNAERARASLEVAVALAETLLQALTVLRQRAVGDLSRPLAILDALLTGDLEGAAARAAEAELPPEVGPVLARAVALVMHPPTPESVAKAIDDAPQEIVHQLFPWTRPFLFDASGGVPLLKGDELRFEGRALLGYNARTWGIVGSGELSFYDVQSAQLISDTIRNGGSLEAWLALGDSKLRIELRASGEITVYDSEIIDAREGATDVLSQETSLMWRGSALAAARYEPNPDMAAGLWLGVGPQYELYDPTHVTPSGVTTIEQNDTWSLLFTSRLRFQARLIERVLALRARSDFKYFQITRDSLGVVVNPGGAALTQVSVESHQIDWVNRLFLELDQRIFGFLVPGLSAGFDYVSLVPETGPSRTALIPVFGAGLRSESF